jgi:hypothetical protein
MKKTFAILSILLTPCLVYGDAHTTAGSGNFSTAGTWTGGTAPVAGDTWTISTGHSVKYDITATTDWGTGSGTACTITGTLYVDSQVGDANNYYLRSSGNIVISAGGAFRVGTSLANPLPTTATFTIDFDSTACGFSSISTTGTLNLFCTEPTRKYVKLLHEEVAGATELTVDADLTADAVKWAVSDAIYVVDVNLTSQPDAEARVIDAGISSDHIHITAGLTADKDAGSYVVLCTRNIRIFGSTGTTSATAVIIAPTSGTAVSNVSAAITGSSSTYGITNGVASWTIGGTLYGLGRGLNSTVSSAVSATLVSCGAYDTSSCSAVTFSGLLAASTYGLYLANNCILSGLSVGQSSGVYASCGTRITGTVTKCVTGVTYGTNTIVSGTISECTTGIYFGDCRTIGATFTGNTYDLRMPQWVVAYNTLFGAGSECYNYTASYANPFSYAESFAHDANSSQFRSWTRGGITDSTTGVAPPSGFSMSYKHTCEDATMWNFRQLPYTVRAGEGIRVRGYMMLSHDMSSSPPKMEIINQMQDPLVSGSYTALATSTIPVSNGTVTTWQVMPDMTWKNTTTLPVEVYVRASAEHATDNVWEIFDVQTKSFIY